MTLPFGLDPVSFGAGFLAAVIVALIVYGMGWFGRQIGAPMKPMVVVHTTGRTPWQVTMGCASAGLLLTALAILVAVVIIVVFLDGSGSELTWLFAAAGVAFLLGILIRAMA